MLITEIKIAGFKSFVDPVSLCIDTGLTGIVGPNGCGKSNLLEALRWAMGASSARTMRGEDMDDLIFYGSDIRPARESAEVSLVIDNQNRRAPLALNDSDILEICRRLRRESGSTYKINGRTVRAKDVQLLFADASAGANSPALVRQGQISELIGAKPQNRRKILEEAAGISGLNSRRHETRLKLTAAETNLERMSEVMAESELHYERLKRQSQKAEKYRVLTDKIDLMKKRIALFQWQSAGIAHVKSESAFKFAIEQTELANITLAKAEHNSLQAHAALEPLRQTEMQLAAHLGQVKIELVRLETQKQAAETEITGMQDRLVALKSETGREQALLKDAEQTLIRLDTEYKALPEEDEIKYAQNLEQIKALHAQNVQSVKEAQAAYSDASAAYIEAEAQRNSLRAARDRAQERKENIRAQSARLKVDNRNIGSISKAKEEKVIAEQAVLDRANDVKHAEKTLVSAEQTETEAKKLYEVARKQSQDVENEIDTFKTEIQMLQRLLDSESIGVKEPVLRMLRVKPGYEIALAVVLGDDLEAGLDPDSNHFWTIPYLFPESGLPPSAIALGLLVDAPPQLEARLSQCGLVEDDQGAVLQKQLKPGQRLVSKSGRLWRWDGYIRHTQGESRTAVQIKTRQSLDQAEEKRKYSVSRLDEAKVHEDQAEQAWQNAKSMTQEALQDVKTAQNSANQAEQSLLKAERAIDHIIAHQSSMDGSIARLKTELEAAEIERADYNRQLQGYDLNHLNKARTVAAEQLEDMQNKANASLSELNTLEDVYKRSVTMRESLEIDIGQWRKRVKETSERLVSIMATQKTIRTNLKDAHEQPKRLDEAACAMREQISAADTKRKMAADKLAIAQAESREADQISRQAVDAAAVAREHFAKIKVECEHNSVKLKDCAEHILITFQIEPENLAKVLAGQTETNDNPESDHADMISARNLDSMHDALQKLKQKRDTLGAVNLEADSEAEALGKRLEQQQAEREDLTKAIEKLRKGMATLDADATHKLLEAFEYVNAHFKALFKALFDGGMAELRLTNIEHPLESGLEIVAQPPGKKLRALSLMSGGEQALTAIALIFAAFLSNPAPICVLDEVDAPLDDTNVDRFCRMLDDMRHRTDTRFIAITHNPMTMSRMDRLFGITMQERGVSRIVSVSLSAAEQLIAAE